MNTERTLQKPSLGKRITKEYKTELSMLGIFAVFFVVLSFASPLFSHHKKYYERDESGVLYGIACHRYDDCNYHIRH